MTSWPWRLSSHAVTAESTPPLKAQMTRADRSGAAVAVILGEDEVASGTAVVKPLRAEVEQQKIAVADLAQAIRPHV